MRRNHTIVFVSMEMLIPEFPEPIRGANFRGGLGILAGDIVEGLKKAGIKAIGIVPFYSYRWANREKISYDSLAQQFFELEPASNRKVRVWKIIRGGGDVYGLECPEVYDVIYTDDRWKRLQQEALIGQTVPLLLKKLDIKPDILWFNESHSFFSTTFERRSVFQRNEVSFYYSYARPSWYGKIL